MMTNKLTLLSVLALTFFSCNLTGNRYDTIIRNGIVYDGTGADPFLADIGIRADTIAFIGDLSEARAGNIIDAKGLAVAPGFINMLSWAGVALIEDGRSQSDIRQGVTLEVMGEGESMGPLSPRMQEQMKKGQGDIKYDVSWNTLGGYMDFMQKKGISCNIASFVGATTIREYVIGEDDRDPTPEEMEQMKALVDEAMREGALGVGSSLIYPPAFFAKTQELIELSKVAAKYDGMYVSHIRNEGNKLFEAVRELITIAKEADCRAEVYHLKAAGRNNWWKVDSLINIIDSARNEGLAITADMYTYNASSTGLTAGFPPSLQDGGFDKLWKRLQDPEIKKQMMKEMSSDAIDWENTYYGAGGGEGVLLLDFRVDSLKKYIGKTLAEVAAIRGKSSEETAIDLIVEDSTRIEVAYFSMDSNNVKKEMAVSWVSFCSDARSISNEGVFLNTSTHPRTYGSFIRVLGKFSRDEKVFPLQEAIRKLTKLPATNLKIQKRGELKVGNYADIVIFDPQKVRDNATFEKPHQYATGMVHVFVNGVQVLKDGDHTGATPGRFVKGPGWKE
ncbi:MAG: D-aminoacylase [Chitinophagaceae bacterium]|nr:D-aminoacylase [Chitinophagaceae bacterium]